MIELKGRIKYFWTGLRTLDATKDKIVGAGLKFYIGRAPDEATNECEE